MVPRTAPQTVPAPVPEDGGAPVVGSLPALAMTLDLMPFPAALIVRDGDVLRIGAANAEFRAAGWADHPEASPLFAALGGRLHAFIVAGTARERIEWRLGEAVDCRYFTVTLGRHPAFATLDHCVAALVDQTSAQRTENSLRREMSTDALTGLPNRAGFGDRVDEMVGDANRAGHAVLAINLDRFSRVNACMGSLTGDELLISVARRLRGALRAGDVLARTGGDEFAVLLRIGDDADEAAAVASRIAQALASPFRLSDFEIRVGCSIGIALGVDAAEEEDLIRHAQFAVKRSKQTGRAETYRPGVFDIVRTRFAIETDLRQAIETDALELAFQPICDLATGRVSSFEALARWPNSGGTGVSPVDFIPVAEESGLIVPLGRWAMDEAARVLAAWDRRAGGDCGARMAVNLSAVQLHLDDIEAMVAGALETHGLAGSRFTLELTESALVADPDRVMETMLALKRLGASIAMDDFGTGYSNLAFLRRLPIDKLKIDRSFVTGMLADRDKVAIVRAIISLSQALGMRTIAEGVESHALEQTLAALGCAFGQGFHYSRPLPADAAYAMLVARNH